MPRQRPQPKSATPLVLCILLIASGFLVTPPSTDAGTVSDCLEYVETPLWIGDVTFKLESGSPESFVQGGVAFVEPGDLLTISFDIVNRVPDACKDLQARLGNPTDRVRVKRWDQDRAPQPWVQLSNVNCAPLRTAGGSCHVRDFIEIAEPPEEDSPSELRVRYMAGNDANTFKALIGVERVIVVDARPELVQDGEIVAVEDDAQVTTGYHQQSLTKMSVRIRNEGTYPHWNPNGGTDYWGRPSYNSEDKDVDIQGVRLNENWQCEWDEPVPVEVDHRPNFRASAMDVCRENAVWAQREHRYRPSEPGLPPCIGDNDLSSHNDTAPPWDNAGGDSTDTTHLVCSYKRGARLPMPFFVQIFREDLDEPVDEILLPSAQVQPSEDQMIEDKNDALLPENSQNFAKTIFDRYYKAGLNRIEVRFAHDGTDWVPGPELSKSNNEAFGEIDVLGVDLEITDPFIAVQQPDGTGGCGTTIENACEAGSMVLLEASYINVGNDDEAHNGGNDLRARSWKAAPYVNGQIIRIDELGRNAIKEQGDVPRTDANDRGLWSPPLRIASLPEGGRQTFEVRLDHPDNYQFDSVPLTRPEGRVAERTEISECPASGNAVVDNVFCVTLFFEDDTVPVIHELSVDGGTTVDNTTEVFEGETVTLQAHVTDNSLTQVEAHVTLPNGTLETENMTRASGSDELWVLDRAFTGELGNVTFGVRAEDAFGHVTNATNNLTFTVVSLASHISFERVVLNDGSDFGDDDHDDHGHAPVYQGTASTPENWLRVEAEISGTGHEDPFTTEGRVLQLFDPDGELRHEVPLGVYKVCDVWNNVTNEPEGTAAGDECEDPEDSPLTRIENVRPRFYVDTRCGPATAPEDEPRTCLHEDEDLHDAWSDVEMGWVGSFELAIQAEDIFERNRSVVESVRLADIDGPPLLEEVDLSTPWLEPGESLEIQGVAGDALRVERVFLRLVKPDGLTEELNLTLDEDLEHEDETRNGTYKGSFATGAAGVIDQAGIYNASLVAIDFARTETNVSLPNLTLNDTDVPVIDLFRSVPEVVQEVGGPITWEAKITDSTAIKTPVLRLTRPTIGSTIHALAYNDTRDLWDLEQPIEATEMELGTWSYTLDVADWAGQAANATGEIEVVLNLPPQATNWKPDVTGSDGRAYGPAVPTISVDVVDFGNGVDPDSIVLSVQGEEVDAEKLVIQHGYRVLYEIDAAESFEDGDVVNVTVAAEDLTEDEPLVATDLVHSFVVDALAPSAQLSLEPVLDGDDHRLVGPDSTLAVHIVDAGAGGQDAEVILQALDGSSVVGQATKTLEPGEPVELSSFEDAFSGHGMYRAFVTASDLVGNVDEVVETFFIDTEGPRIAVFSQPGEPPESVFADITDDSGIASATLTYTAAGFPEPPIEMTEHDSTWQATIPAFPRNTLIAYTITARDIFGNHADSQERSFKAGDTPPTIVVQSPQDGDIVSGTSPVAWTASDMEEPSSTLTISLFYKQGDGPFIPVEGGLDLQNRPPFQLDSTKLPNGGVTLQAIVFDGTNFGEDLVDIVVRNLDGIFANPRIRGIDAAGGAAQVAPDADLVFEVDVTGPVRAVWANLTDGQATLASLQLKPTASGTWVGELKAPDSPGDYAIDLTAVGPDGVTSSQGVYAFTVQSATAASFVGEWTALVMLFVVAAAVGTYGLTRRW